MILNLFCFVMVCYLGKKVYNVVMEKLHSKSSVEDRNLVVDITEYVQLQQTQIQVVNEVQEPTKKIEVKEACIKGTEAEHFYDSLIDEIESLFGQDIDEEPVTPVIEHVKETWIARVLDVAFSNVLFEIEDMLLPVDLGKKANELLRNDVVLLDVLVNPQIKKDFKVLDLHHLSKLNIDYCIPDENYQSQAI